MDVASKVWQVVRKWQLFAACGLVVRKCGWSQLNVARCKNAYKLPIDVEYMVLLTQLVGNKYYGPALGARS